MALEAQDLMTLKALGNGRDGGMTPYEQVKIGHMQSKRASGVGIAGLAVGIGAAVAAVGVGFYANSKANAAKDVAVAKYDGLRDIVTLTAQNLAAERAERINGDQFTFTQTQTDTQSGSQQGTIASQIENSAISQATAQVMAGLMTGNYSENAQKVQLMTPPREFQCGCGCNG